jgi:adenosylmethionine---8-amino-7-oxononanoate aminotransferase
MLKYSEQNGMNDFILKDKDFIWHPFTPLIGADDPILITSAEGVYLNTNDGRKIIDAVSSWWVNIHGHSNPDIAKTLAEQASTLEHVIFAGFTHEPAIKLAQNLLSILPKNQSKIFYSDNGSTAVEVGIKMAMQYWYNKGVQSRKKIIALKGAYHGDTFGAMSIGDRNIFTDPFSSYLFDVTFIDFPDHDNEKRSIDQFKSLIENNDTAAFIFEPLVQAAGGMRMYSPSVLDELIKMAQANDVICIADEVFTGFGRTGKLFASDHLQSQPDIIALSKGITGGTMPLGVTTCNNKIISAYNTEEFTKTFFHGHSYTANPLACAVANTSFKLLIDKTCLMNIDRISGKHIDFKNEIAAHKNIQHVRVLGTILAIELRNNETTSYTNSARKRIYKYFLEQNILLRPLGNIIYVLPPYIITNEELASIYKAIIKFLNSY